MPRVPQQAGEKGSLRWIQEFVNRRASELDHGIASATSGSISEPIDWRSPMRSDDYAEYRDQTFVELLGIDLATRPLNSFWPRQGPQWDALGVDPSGARILVEAKANVPEAISPPTQAGESSRSMIEAALEETAKHLGVQSTCDWSGTFYQYANRLAHLYLLHELNHIDAWLVFVYFIGDSDVNGPRTQSEWKAAIQVLEGALGLKKHPLLGRRVDVFLIVPTPRD